MYNTDNVAQKQFQAAMSPTLGNINVLYIHSTHLLWSMAFMQHTIYIIAVQSMRYAVYAQGSEL